MTMWDLQSHSEIYPGSKKTHFRVIFEQSKIGGGVRRGGIDWG
jgi:hypothetical protein